MTKVYLIWHYVSYEGQELFGIYSTEEKANSALVNLIKTTFKRYKLNESGEYENPNHGAHLFVQEHGVL